MTKDWREAGRQIRRERAESMPYTIPSPPKPGSLLAAFAEATEREERSFKFAFEALRGGNSSPLAAYLRSDRPLMDEDRQRLADYVEGNLQQRKAKRGRPRNRNLDLVAYEAESIFLRWQGLNIRNGVADWGHREDMRRESAEIAVEEWPDFGVTVEEVLRLLSRPNYRRNSEEFME